MRSPYYLGRKAFLRGLPALPSADKEFKKNYLEGAKVGEALKHMQEWAEGWHTANVNEKEV